MVTSEKELKSTEVHQLLSKNKKEECKIDYLPPLIPLVAKASPKARITAVMFYLFNFKMKIFPILGHFQHISDQKLEIFSF